MQKNLLLARVRAINIILDNIGKQTQLCRSKIASILSSMQRFRECQGFIEKVSKIINKVKQRQVNKFNHLLRKEGNITGISTQFSFPKGRQVTMLLGTVLLPRQSVQPPGKA